MVSRGVEPTNRDFVREVREVFEQVGLRLTLRPVVGIVLQVAEPRVIFLPVNVLDRLHLRNRGWRCRLPPPRPYLSCCPAPCPSRYRWGTQWLLIRTHHTIDTGLVERLPRPDSRTPYRPRTAQSCDPTRYTLHSSSSPSSGPSWFLRNPRTRRRKGYKWTTGTVAGHRHLTAFDVPSLPRSGWVT